MIIDFFDLWNPFKLFGTEVGIEDLLRSPLEPQETLRQDRLGRFKRVRVPNTQSKLLTKIFFWLQKQINRTEHLETIDKLITLFHGKILLSTLEKTETLQQLHGQINRMQSLKNDYGFVYIKSTDSSFIDIRLQEVEREAYLIFAQHYATEAEEQEKERRNGFQLFQQETDRQLEQLSKEHLISFMKIRLLNMVPYEILKDIFNERAVSIQERLSLVQQMNQAIEDIQRSFAGKFTIDFMDAYLNYLKRRLLSEMGKIEVEAELMIQNLILVYRLSPYQQEVKQMLLALSIDPDGERKSLSCAAMFHEAMEWEIDRLRRLFLAS